MSWKSRLALAAVLLLLGVLLVLKYAGPGGSVETSSAVRSDAETESIPAQRTRITAQREPTPTGPAGAQTLVHSSRQALKRQSLGRVVDPARETALVSTALKGPDTEQRIEALRRLVRPGAGPEVRAMLFEVLADSDSRIRLEAIRGFETLPDPDAIPILRSVARRDPSPEIRRIAAELTAELSARFERPTP